MPIIESKLNPRSEDFRANAAALEAVVADLRAKIEQLRRAAAARDKHLSRGSCCRATASRNCSIRARRSSSSRSSRRTACTTTTRRARASSPDRPHRGPRMRDRVQRRDGQGRHVLPGHREEARARAGNRRGKPAAVRVPRRLGRREPAEPGRRVSRSRPLRPHLLQPGDDVGGRNCADRRRDGVMHGGGACRR